MTYSVKHNVLKRGRSIGPAIRLYGSLEPLDKRLTAPVRDELVGTTSHTKYSFSMQWSQQVIEVLSSFP